VKKPCSQSVGGSKARGEAAELKSKKGAKSNQGKKRAASQEGQHSTEPQGGNAQKRLKEQIRKEEGWAPQGEQRETNDTDEHGSEDSKKDTEEENNGRIRSTRQRSEKREREKRK